MPAAQPGAAAVDPPHAGLRRFFAGAVSGAVAKTVVAPFDRVKILMQVSRMYGPAHGIYSGGVGATFRAVRAREGVAGFWRGNSATLARIAPYSAIQYSAFEAYNRALATHVFAEDKSPAKRFVAGGMAGCSAVMGSYPIDLARTRLAVKTGRRVAGAPGWGVIGALGQIWKEGGVRALYTGAYPTVVGVVPYSGISFMTFGVLKNFCSDRGIGDGSPYIVTMACGSLAGLNAQLITYPLDMVRRRSQALHAPEKMSRNERLFHRSSMAPGRGRIMGKFSIYRSVVFILRKEGIVGLYQGVSMNFFKTAPAMAISFSLYDVIRQHLNVPSSKFSATGG